jgi:hypothetical protein
MSLRIRSKQTMKGEVTFAVVRRVRLSSALQATCETHAPERRRYTSK